MPSKYRIHMTVSQEVFEAIDTIAQVQNCSRGSVLADWVALSEPCLISMSELLSKASNMSRTERNALAEVLSDVSYLISRHSDDMAEFGDGDSRTAGGGGEPPTSNTGVPSYELGAQS